MRFFYGELGVENYQVRDDRFRIYIFNGEVNVGKEVASSTVAETGTDRKSNYLLSAYLKLS